MGKGILRGQLYKLNTVKELTELLNGVEEFKVYGVGYYLHLFLKGLEELKFSYSAKVTCILVSDAGNNPKEIANIPVMSYKYAGLKSNDYIILTLGHRYTDEIYKQFENIGVNLVQINFNMFQQAAYQKVKKGIQLFFDHFPQKLSGLNQFLLNGRIMAWTC